MVFVIKRLIYIEFRVLWKGKKKKDLEVQEPGRATTHFGSYLETWSLHPYVAKRFPVSRSCPGRTQDRAWVRATEPLGSMSRHDLPVLRQGSQACWVTSVATKLF